MDNDEICSYASYKISFLSQTYRQGLLSQYLMIFGNCPISIIKLIMGKRRFDKFFIVFIRTILSLTRFVGIGSNPGANRPLIRRTIHTNRLYSLSRSKTDLKD